MLHITPFFQCGAVEENAYLLEDEAAGLAAVVDPGFPPQAAERLIDGKTIKYILLTHCHFDHIAGAQRLRELTGAPILLHEADLPGVEDPRLNLGLAFGQRISFRADRALKDGEKIFLGESELTVLHTPGHTRGSCCYLSGESMFSGDMLFRDSVGRTDFPTGSPEEMQRSIEKLKLLPGDFTVYPVHGELTTLSREKAENPYFLYGLI